MNHATVLKRAQNVTFEVVAGEAILIDMNSGTYFSLDEVGTAFWEMLDGSRTLGELAAELAVKYSQHGARYVAAVQQAYATISEAQIDDLALEYGLEDDEVREHVQMFATQGAEAAAELTAVFTVTPETVLHDLADLVATMQHDNLVVVVK